MVDAEVEPGELLGSQPLYPVRRQSLVSRPQPQDSSAHTAVAVAVPSLHGQLHEEIPATHTQTGVINIDSSSHTAVAQTAVINIDSSSHTAVAVSSCHAQLHHKIPATRTQTAVINVDSSSHTAAAVPSRRSQLHQEIPATHRYMHAHTHTHTQTHTHTAYTQTELIHIAALIITVEKSLKMEQAEKRREQTYRHTRRNFTPNIQNTVLHFLFFSVLQRYAQPRLRKYTKMTFT